MKRGATGRYDVTAVGGEEVRAFVPHPLPPDPPLVLSGALERAVERAVLAVGRLDGISSLLPDRGLFLYAYVRKEAVLSSQIEGTRSTLSDLLLFEMDEAPGVPMDDVVEVSRYVAALDHGLERMRAGFPISSRLIRDMHGILLAQGRGQDRDPGHFRRTQNWIGGSRPGNAMFVPPPAPAVPDLIADLERFVHDPGPHLPDLVRAGLLHVQFETIHPFLDGNGRIGRLLITLLLIDAGLLREPLLYLSLYFKRHRGRYYELLDVVRTKGDWEAWLEFFLEGVQESAEGAVVTAQRLDALFAEDRAAVAELGRRAGSALRVHNALKHRPISTIQFITEWTGLAFPTVSSSLDRLVELGVAREITGKQRNRIFAYDRYLATLSEGTEPR